MSLSKHVGIQGVTFVRDESLVGKKHAVQYKDSPKEIHVSPAMYELLGTDLDKLLVSLRVKEVERDKKKGD